MSACRLLRLASPGTVLDLSAAPAGGIVVLDAGAEESAALLAALRTELAGPGPSAIQWSEPPHERSPLVAALAMPGPPRVAHPLEVEAIARGLEERRGAEADGGRMAGLLPRLQELRARAAVAQRRLPHDAAAAALPPRDAEATRRELSELGREHDTLTGRRAQLRRDLQAARRRELRAQLHEVEARQRAHAEQGARVEALEVDLRSLAELPEVAEAACERVRSLVVRWRDAGARLEELRRLEIGQAEELAALREERTGEELAETDQELEVWLEQTEELAAAESAEHALTAALGGLAGDLASRGVDVEAGRAHMARLLALSETDRHQLRGMLELVALRRQELAAAEAALGSAAEQSRRAAAGQEEQARGDAKVTRGWLGVAGVSTATSILVAPWVAGTVALASLSAALLRGRPAAAARRFVEAEADARARRDAVGELARRTAAELDELLARSGFDDVPRLQQALAHAAELRQVYELEGRRAELRRQAELARRRLEQDGRVVAGGHLPTPAELRERLHRGRRWRRLDRQLEQCRQEGAGLEAERARLSEELAAVAGVLDAPAPGRSGLGSPAPGRSGLGSPAPGRSGLGSPAPGRSGLGRSGLVPEDAPAAEREEPGARAAAAERLHPEECLGRFEAMARDRRRLEAIRDHQLPALRQLAPGEAEAAELARRRSSLNQELASLETELTGDGLVADSGKDPGGIAPAAGAPEEPSRAVLQAELQQVERELSGLRARLAEGGRQLRAAYLGRLVGAGERLGAVLERWCGRARARQLEPALDLALGWCARRFPDVAAAVRQLVAMERRAAGGRGDLAAVVLAVAMADTLVEAPLAPLVLEDSLGLLDDQVLAAALGWLAAEVAPGRQVIVVSTQPRRLDQLGAGRCRVHPPA